MPYLTASHPFNCKLFFVLKKGSLRIISIGNPFFEYNDSPKGSLKKDTNEKELFGEGLREVFEHVACQQGICEFRRLGTRWGPTFSCWKLKVFCRIKG